ncbi:hypothetical protein BKA70DRAFT_1219839 [Coprinopsis sp. MPI-PUGE-AT-0042]|nr:hypothetical protein BKA70DRAFT_1219839 [Coprinopsis sp. MPI-PUGE-AT-0042]
MAWSTHYLSGNRHARPCQLGAPDQRWDLAPPGSRSQTWHAFYGWYGVGMGWHGLVLGPGFKAGWKLSRASESPRSTAGQWVDLWLDWIRIGVQVKVKVSYKRCQIWDRDTSFPRRGGGGGAPKSGNFVGSVCIQAARIHQLSFNAMVGTLVGQMALEEEDVPPKTSMRPPCTPLSPSGPKQSVYMSPIVIPVALVTVKQGCLLAYPSRKKDIAWLKLQSAVKPNWPWQRMALLKFKLRKIADTSRLILIPLLLSLERG